MFKVGYYVDSAWFDMIEDIYSEGEVDDYYNSQDIYITKNETAIYKEIKEAVNEFIKKYTCFYEIDESSIGIFDDKILIEGLVVLNNAGDIRPINDDEMKQWQNGEIKAYNIVYRLTIKKAAIEDVEEDELREKTDYCVL